MSKGRLITSALVGLSAVAILALSWANTLVDYLKAQETGELHLALMKANLVLAPVAVVLFGLAFGWLRERRFVVGAAAFLPLPVWSAVLLWVENWVANDFWFAIVGLRFQGIDPFGATG